jgi:hypothetical protein
MRDKREQLILDVAGSGQTPYVVYGGDGINIRLISLQEDIDREALARDRANGLTYAGVVGLVQGTPRIASAPDAGSRELEALRYAGLSLVHQTFGDSVSWLESLWALPDTRTQSANA